MQHGMDRATPLKQMKECGPRNSKHTPLKLRNQYVNSPETEGAHVRLHDQQVLQISLNS